MRVFALALLALAGFGCAAAHPRSALPDYSGIKAVPADQRSSTYEQLKVAEVQGNEARIGQNWYNIHDLKEIYRENNAQKARGEVKSAFAHQLALDIAPPATLGLATFLGLYVGLLNYASTANTSYTYNGTDYDQKITYDESARNGIWIGAGIGAAVGLIAAAVERMVLSRKVTQAISNSGDLFNLKLRDNLNLNLEPQSGGAKATLGKSF